MSPALPPEQNGVLSDDKLKFANGITILKSQLPRVEPLEANAAVELKAAAYGPFTQWYEVRVDAFGFPVYQCASPVSQEIHTISHHPRRGHYCCDCLAGKRLLRMPVHRAEATCWHLYEFNAVHLPGIMEKRRMSLAPPAPVTTDNYGKDWD